MKSFSEVLKNTLNTSPLAERQQPMQQPGLTSKGGVSTMQGLSSGKASSRGEVAISEQQIPLQQHETLARKSSGNAVSSEKGRPWQEMPLSQSWEAQDALTALLYQTYASQKAYSDKAEMMEYRDGMFQMILEEYSFTQIRAAFIQHIRTSRDLPCPADIVQIIDPKPEPLSQAVYIELGKKAREGKFLLPHETAYRRAYERQESAKVHGGHADLYKAKQVMESYGF